MSSVQVLPHAMMRLEFVDVFTTFSLMKVESGFALLAARAMMTVLVHLFVIPSQVFASVPVRLFGKQG